MQEYQTPHITTAMTGPLHLLERQLLDNRDLIEDWFGKQWNITPAPVYGSVDLRNSGFKLAPVDMNLFPAGFNNLNPAFFQLSVEAAKISLLQSVPGVKKILLMPENHTRNPFYWENVITLKKILRLAGFEVQIGSIVEGEMQRYVSSVNGEEILIGSVIRDNNHLSVSGFTPDAILLNNDLSEGIPDVLKNLQQPILPLAELGWSLRLKSGHFQHYANVSDEFAKLIHIDPWFIAPFFRHCGEINFMENEGAGCLPAYAEELFADIQKKYREYEIDAAPFIIVKADAGTYGMAVMTVRNADELRMLNRKQRTKMSKTKGGRPVKSVILQEGVYTFETWGQENMVAEPVVYLWGQRVVGGFYRVHKERGVDENLNSPGMHFEPLAFVKTCYEPIFGGHPDECENRFYAYGVISRLSMLAAAREMWEHKK